jgi:hypothetical protein
MGNTLLPFPKVAVSCFTLVTLLPFPKIAVSCFTLVALLPFPKVAVLCFMLVTLLPFPKVAVSCFTHKLPLSVSCATNFKEGMKLIMFKRPYISV